MCQDKKGRREEGGGRQGGKEKCQERKKETWTVKKIEEGKESEDAVSPWQPTPGCHFLLLLGVCEERRR